MSWHSRSPGEKSPEFNALAQLCGVVGAAVHIGSLYDALRKCLALGERGWLTAIALLNVALGGNVPVPDLVSVVPPGYARYLTRVALVDDKVLHEVLKDVPLPKGYVRMDVEVPDKEKEGESAKLVLEISRFPMAFGVFVEYDHPEHGLERSLWVVYYVQTGDYPFKSFPAPRAVADEVAKYVGREVAVERPHAYDEIAEYVKSLASRYGSVKEFLKAVREGTVALPEGVDVSVERRKQEEEEGRRQRRSPS